MRDLSSGEGSQKMFVFTHCAIVCCVLVAVLHFPTFAFEICKTDSLKTARSLYLARRLRSRVIDSQPISMPIMCHMKCLDNCRCLSYNVCNGGKLSELNSEKKDNNMSLFETSEECDYHEFTFTTQQSSDCHDRCCSTSEPCLHGARCQTSCMENGQRFQCTCSEGQSGERCENIPRNCAFYEKPADASLALRVIYAADNITSYRTFCYFGSYYKYTLAFSYSVENQPLFKDQPLSSNYPVFEDSPNWQTFRLGLSRMKGLREGATFWKVTCSYDQRGRNEDHVLLVPVNRLDPLVSHNKIVCVKVQKVRINGQGCENCDVAMAHGRNAWHMAYHQTDSCSSAVQVLPKLPCSAGYYSYFGNYNTKCLDDNFWCTSSPKATTQLWFLHAPSLN